MQVLKAHPDKGGNAAVFREVQASWETLRGLFETQKIKTFASAAAGNAVASNYEAVFTGFEGMPTQPYEYYEVRGGAHTRLSCFLFVARIFARLFVTPATYAPPIRQAAAEEPVPFYRVELAKSGRSACKATGSSRKCTGGAPVAQDDPPSFISKVITPSSLYHSIVHDHVQLAP